MAVLGVARGRALRTRYRLQIGASPLLVRRVCQLNHRHARPIPEPGGFKPAGFKPAGHQD